jgi:hypothetical protein
MFLENNQNSNNVLMSSSSYNNDIKNIYYTYQGNRHLVAQYLFTVTNPGTSNAVGHLYVQNKVSPPIDFTLEMIFVLHYLNGNTHPYSVVGTYPAGFPNNILEHLSANIPYLNTISVSDINIYI